MPVGWEVGVGHCRDAASFPTNGPFISLGFFFWVAKLCLFFKGMVFIWVLLLGMLVALREPTPCYHDAYSVGIPEGAYGGKSGQNRYKTTVSPLLNVFFWLVNGLFIFSGGGGLDAAYWPG